MLICGDVRPVRAVFRLRDAQIFSEKDLQKFLKLFWLAQYFHELIIAENYHLVCIFYGMVSTP